MVYSYSHELHFLVFKVFCQMQRKKFTSDFLKILTYSCKFRPEGVKTKVCDYKSKIAERVLFWYTIENFSPIGSDEGLSSYGRLKFLDKYKQHAASPIKTSMNQVKPNNRAIMHRSKICFSRISNLL